MSAKFPEAERNACGPIHESRRVIHFSGNVIMNGQRVRRAQKIQRFMEKVTHKSQASHIRVKKHRAPSRIPVRAWHFAHQGKLLNRFMSVRRRLGNCDRMWEVVGHGIPRKHLPQIIERRLWAPLKHINPVAMGGNAADVARKRKVVETCHHVLALDLQLVFKRIRQNARLICAPGGVNVNRSVL